LQRAKLFPLSLGQNQHTSTDPLRNALIAVLHDALTGYKTFTNKQQFKSEAHLNNSKPRRLSNVSPNAVFFSLTHLGHLFAETF